MTFPSLGGQLTRLFSESILSSVSYVILEVPYSLGESTVGVETFAIASIVYSTVNGFPLEW